MTVSRVESCDLWHRENQWLVSDHRSAPNAGRFRPDLKVLPAIARRLAPPSSARDTIGGLISPVGCLFATSDTKTGKPNEAPLVAISRRDSQDLLSFTLGL